MHAHRARVVAVVLAGLAAYARADDSRPMLPLETRQLLVVTVTDWQAANGRLQRFARDGGRAWAAEGPSERVTIGRSGSGWGLGTHPLQSEGPTKREGDGRSPAGVFELGPAFGSLPNIATQLAYLPLDGGHWCIDVPDSPLYNRIVHEQVVGPAAIAGSSEPMRRDIHMSGDQQYRLGFVIRHNPDGQAAAGSCIFAHPWVDEQTPTAGCIGMAEETLATMLAWLDATAEPRMVLLPMAEYRRLQHAWGLPAEPEPFP